MTGVVYMRCYYFLSHQLQNKGAFPRHSQCLAWLGPSGRVRTDQKVNFNADTLLRQS